jgi:hypothetical protein
MQTFQFPRSGSRSNPSFQVTAEAEEQANRALQHCSTTSEAIRTLHNLGWSNSAICRKLTYPTTTEKHKAGDPLLPQHVATTISNMKANQMTPAQGPVRSQPVRSLASAQLVDVNPNRQTLEEIEKSEETEEERKAREEEDDELERQIKAEEDAKRG